VGSGEQQPTVGLNHSSSSKHPGASWGKSSSPGLLSLSGGGGQGRMGALLRSAALGGQSGLLLRLLLSSVANRCAHCCRMEATCSLCVPDDSAAAGVCRAECWPVFCMQWRVLAGLLVS
jgi:hypothetical protein